MVTQGHTLFVGDSMVAGTGWIMGTWADGDRQISLVEETVCTLQGCPDGDITIAFPGRPSVELPWSAAAWESLEEDVLRLGPVAGRLLLRGHHEHVLADGPACLRWLNRCDEAELPCGIALSPASMLASSMIEARDDHLVRMFEYLGARSEVVIIEDLGLDDAGQPGGRPLGQGLLPGRLLGSLLDDHIAPGVPIVVLGPDREAAQEWLWPA